MANLEKCAFMTLIIKLNFTKFIYEQRMPMTFYLFLEAKVDK